MPIPKKRKDQDPKKFISNCMGSSTMKKEYPDQSQRVAICIQQSKADLVSQADMYIQFANAEWNDEWDEFVYDIAISSDILYEDDRDKTLNESDKPSKVKLNNPFRTPSGPKKFSVYVKNDSGNVVKVNFGDPNMEIKRDDPERRKSYRARHNCDNPGPKWKANYWSCKMWSGTNVSDLT
jgi:hypothetical protein